MREEREKEKRGKVGRFFGGGANALFPSPFFLFPFSNILKLKGVKRELEVL